MASFSDCVCLVSQASRTPAAQRRGLPGKPALPTPPRRSRLSRRARRASSHPQTSPPHSHCSTKALPPPPTAPRRTHYSTHYSLCHARTAPVLFQPSSMLPRVPAASLTRGARFTGSAGACPPGTTALMSVRPARAWPGEAARVRVCAGRLPAELVCLFVFRVAR